MTKAGVPRLLQPVRVGNMELKHRVVLAPLTRMRNVEYVPTKDSQRLYYEQRASEGGLLISEATLISPSSGSYKLAPGIWSDEQVAGWKKITDAVHAKGGKIFAQLWHLGRASGQTYEYKGKKYPPLAPSPIKCDEKHEVPKEMTLEEIKAIPGEYAHAARQAIAAGFDGVELHNANGYLLDQFLQEISNKRTDDYGGSMDNRHRLPLEVTKAVCDAVGEERVGSRMSPFSSFQSMRDEHPTPNFVGLMEKILAQHPRFAYFHVIEGRGGTPQTVPEGTPLVDEESLEPLRDVVRKHAAKHFPGEDFDASAAPKFISAGGFLPEDAKELSERSGDLVAFGRQFIANPDLPRRIELNAPLNKYDRSTFYAAKGDESGHTGYTDYPTLQQSSL